MLKQDKTIESVVLAGLCTSCGTCVAICTQGAASMVETPGGLLFAKVNATKCNACGLCLRSCGGRQLATGLLPSNVDPFKGQVLQAYCGFANDPEIRLRGQSGGVVTALLSFLLESGRADHALVNRMPEDGSLRPEAYLAQNKGGLLQSQGSKYCPVALNAAIPGNIGKAGKGLAVVGLPCHMHSLRNVQEFNESWKNGIVLTVGLFCDRTLAYGVIDYLIDKGKVSCKDVATFRYRDKTQGGWPGSIFIKTKHGTETRLPSRERQVVKDYFTPPRCRLCFDKMNILCDIAVGDAWGVKEDGAGYSVLIARTEAGLTALAAAEEAGYLVLQEVSAESIFSGQGVEARRRQWTGFSNLRRKRGEELPDFRISTEFYGKTTKESEASAKSLICWSDVLLEKSSKKIIRAVKLRRLIQGVKLKKFWNFT